MHQAAGGAPNITFLPPVPKAELVHLFQRARAVIFAAEEDFGITTVEAQACGTPVIAYGRGGAREIIHTGPGPLTGVLFEEQTPESLMAAVREFESRREEFDPITCRANAERFSAPRFRQEIKELVERAYLVHGKVPEPAKPPLTIPPPMATRRPAVHAVHASASPGEVR